MTLTARRASRWMMASTALLLSGCVSFSPDGGMSLVSATVSKDLGKDAVALRTPDETAAARNTAKRLLSKPLSADAAVQIALLNNRGLQAAYNELAIEEARAVEASLPPNPAISLSRIAGSVEVEVERRIVANILALATLPVRSEIAAARFRQAQIVALSETLRVAADTRRAYYRAVASRELADFLAQAQSGAETAAKFAIRLGETGGMNKLDQAREQVFYADLTAQLAATRQRAASERESLIRAMGLWGDDLAFKMASALPPLPSRPQSLPGIETEAVRRHVDLQIGRIELDALAKSYGLTQATRFINVLDAGFAARTNRNKTTGERIRDRGFDVELQVPIFDFGEVRVREAEATYMHAVNRLMERAVNVRSDARDAYRSYRSAYDITAHYQKEVLPLRKIISDETLLRYNGMLIDVFSLLAEARQRIAATTAAIEAKRDFWLATTNLNTAVMGGGVAGRSETAMSAASAEAPQH
ncbi:TolC family protein [Afipia birgiae]|uniref:TolC family protein n=1 Tax=Afipia birgiae TaxID=151414 RepID=UPI0003812531|nr:TolC family protein [Afipia birgiae]